MPHKMVTVIMPARNAEETISKAIFSVLNQSFKNWQLLVVDDGSTDNTASLVNTFAMADSRIKLLRQTEWSGVAAARNYALQHVNTQFVAFLDSDDYWEPEKLTVQMHFLMQSGTAITYAPYRRVNNDGAEIGTVSPPSQLNYQFMLRANFIGNLTAVFDRNKLPDLWFKKTGNEDYVFWLEALKMLDEPILATPSNIPLANYRVTKSSLSGNKLRSARWQWEVYRRTLRLGVLRSIACMVSYCYYSILKRRRRG